MATANSFNLLNKSNNDVHYAFVMGEPSNFEEAISCENSNEWGKTMDDEYKSLTENNTWNLVKLPSGEKKLAIAGFTKSK